MREGKVAGSPLEPSPVAFMSDFGPNCPCARWKQLGCWPAASSAWDPHLAQEAPAPSCPGQVGCYISSVLFLRSHAGVVENGFPFSLVPPLLYLFSKTPLWKYYHSFCLSTLRVDWIKEIPELWELQEDLWHQSTAALLSGEILTRKQNEEL